MASWGAHAVCQTCWLFIFASPETRDVSDDPDDRDDQTCCWCGAWTGHGYWARADADVLKHCRGHD